MEERKALKLAEQFILNKCIKNVIENPQYLEETKNGGQHCERNSKIGKITLSILDLIKDIDKENSYDYEKPKYRLESITWRDSNMYISQCSIDGDFDIAIIESIGFIIYEDDYKIVLAGDIIDGDARRVISIPKENIIK